MKPPKIGFKDMWRQFAEAKVPDNMPPSAQYDKARSCLCKKAHPTTELADKALKLANASGTGIYVKYHCRWCKMWHIGHQPKERTNGTL
jgi:hypothetical protein